MKTIAVTSASGKLGAEVVRAIRETIRNANVIGLARTPSKAQSLGVEIRPGDYESPGDLKESLSGVDVVLLVSGMDKPEKRVVQHRNVIQAAKASGVQKIVYTSIQGADEATAFSPVVQSNRSTEEDVRSSGLEWVVGRNGIYIEPDVEYIDAYKRRGEIANCAGDGRCGYTTRQELAAAYASMLANPEHNGQTYNLHGTPITQRQLVDYLNQAFATDLVYREMSVEEYRDDRRAELGEFMGDIIAGIYEGIRDGAVNNESQFEKAAGRPHLRWDDYFDRIA